MNTSAREESRAPARTPPIEPPMDASLDEAVRRRRLRRFGLALAAVVVLLVLFAVGYVKLFDRVLADPSRPPTATAAPNPRVLTFELLLAAAIAVGATTWWVRRQRRTP